MFNPISVTLELGVYTSVLAAEQGLHWWPA